MTALSKLAARWSWLAPVFKGRERRAASLQQQQPMVGPGIAYYVLTASGIVISLAVIAATFDYGLGVAER